MKQKTAIALIAILIVILTIYVVRKYCIVEDVIPEKEVEEIELKRTFVRIFYPKCDSEEIGYEDLMISTSDLISDPYRCIVELAMQKPKEEGLENFYDSNVKILSVYKSNNCVIIDFSSEFKDCFTGNSQKLEKTVKSLKKTLQSFTEIDNIQILVDSQEIPMVSEISNTI